MSEDLDFRRDIISEALLELKVDAIEMIDHLLCAFDEVSMILISLDRKMFTDRMRESIESGNLANAFATICTIRVNEAENIPINKDTTMGQFLEEVKIYYEKNNSD